MTNIIKSIGIIATLVLVATACIKEPTFDSHEMEQRSLKAWIEKYHPDEMAVEELFFNTNITTGIRVAEARGVILMCAKSKGVKISEYTPLQVKQAVAGYGRAEKQQVQQMTKLLLNLPSVPKPDDTADALAIAICHGHSYNPRRDAYISLGKN